MHSKIISLRPGIKNLLAMTTIVLVSGCTQYPGSAFDGNSAANMNASIARTPFSPILACLGHIVEQKQSAPLTFVLIGFNDGTIRDYAPADGPLNDAGHVIALASISALNTHRIKAVHDAKTANDKNRSLIRAGRPPRKIIYFQTIFSGYDRTNTINGGKAELSLPGLNFGRGVDYSTNTITITSVLIDTDGFSIPGSDFSASAIQRANNITFNLSIGDSSKSIGGQRGRGYTMSLERAQRSLIELAIIRQTAWTNNLDIDPVSKCQENVEANMIQQDEVTQQFSDGFNFNGKISPKLVKKTQTALKSLGFYNGKIDGIIGPASTHSLRKFQAKKQLIPTGILNTQTYAALMLADRAMALTAKGIKLHAKGASWIQIKNEETGKLLLTRLLRKGDAYEVPPEKGLVLMTGNAGNLLIEINEQKYSIGGQDTVIRDFPLNRRDILARI